MKSSNAPGCQNMYDPQRMAQREVLLIVPRHAGTKPSAQREQLLTKFRHAHEAVMPAARRAAAPKIALPQPAEIQREAPPCSRGYAKVSQQSDSS